MNSVQQNEINNIPIEATELALTNVVARLTLEGELLIENSQGQSLDVAGCLAQLNRQGNLKTLLATVWVPSQLVILTEVFVPGKRSSDWMAALPYALEESLSEPVETLHFAVLNRTKEGYVSVAVVAHKWMQHWIETLQTLGLGHAQLIPDCFRVPFQTDLTASPLDEEIEAIKLVWSVVQEQSTLYVRSGVYSGFSVNENGFEAFKTAAENADVDDGDNNDNETKKTITINALTSADLLNSQLNSESSGLNGGTQLTLRTRDYQVRSKNLTYWQDWRWPTLLVGLLLVASLVATSQKTQKLAAQTALYQSQTEQLFKEMFPDVKRIVNIKMQTQTRLNNQSSGQSNAVSLVALLQEIEPLFEAELDVIIYNIQWYQDTNGGVLQLMVEATQTSQLQRIVTMSQAKQGGVKVELELKNVSPTLVEGVFNVYPK